MPSTDRSHTPATAFPRSSGEPNPRDPGPPAHRAAHALGHRQGPSAAEPPRLHLRVVARTALRARHASDGPSQHPLWRAVSRAGARSGPPGGSRRHGVTAQRRTLQGAVVQRAPASPVRHPRRRAAAARRRPPRQAHRAHRAHRQAHRRGGRLLDREDVVADRRRGHGGREDEQRAQPPSARPGSRRRTARGRCSCRRRGRRPPAARRPRADPRRGPRRCSPPTPTPACCASAAASTVAVNGAQVAQPEPQHDDGGQHVEDVRARRAHAQQQQHPGAAQMNGPTVIGSRGPIRDASARHRRTAPASTG